MYKNRRRTERAIHVTLYINYTDLAYSAVFHFLIVCERQNKHVRYRLAVTYEEHAVRTQTYN